MSGINTKMHIVKVAEIKGHLRLLTVIRTTKFIKQEIFYFLLTFKTEGCKITLYWV